MQNRRKFMTGSAATLGALSVFGAVGVANAANSNPNAPYGKNYWLWRVSRLFAKRWKDERGSNFYMYRDLSNGLLSLEIEHFLPGEPKPYGLLDTLELPYASEYNARSLADRVSGAQEGLQQKRDITLERNGLFPWSGRKLIINVAEDGEPDKFEYLVPPSYRGPQLTREQAVSAVTTRVRNDIKYKRIAKITPAHVKYAHGEGFIGRFDRRDRLVIFCTAWTCLRAQPGEGGVS